MAEFASAGVGMGEGARAWMPRHMRGLLGRELLAHGGMLRMHWAILLAFGLAFPLFSHPAWMLALGVAYGLLAAPAIGGLDAQEGSEEFAFALPCTRDDIFRSRALLAIGTLAALLGAGLGMIALDVPARLWSLAVDSGFVKSNPHASLAWYVYATALPWSLSCCTFAFASLGRGSASIATGRSSALIAVAATIAVMVAENVVWGHLTGAFAGPVLAVLGLAMLFIGHWRFLTKEATSHDSPARRGVRIPLMQLVVLGVLLVAVLVVLVAFMMVTRHAPEALAPREQQVRPPLSAPDQTPAAPTPAPGPSRPPIPVK